MASRPVEPANGRTRAAIPPWPPRVVGHRGAAARAPENTLAGLAAAHEAGCTWAEVDVKLSRDGVPVLYHDDALGRTTAGAGTVAETDLAELMADAGSHFATAYRDELVPTLSLAITLAGELGLGLNLEIKPSPDRAELTAQRTIAVARATWPATLPAPVLASFTQSSLAVAAAEAPAWPRACLWDALPDDWAATAAALDVCAVHMNQRHITPATSAAVHDAGYKLCAYTCNDPDQAVSLRALGVDGIISDDPGPVAAALPS